MQWVLLWWMCDTIKCNKKKMKDMKKSWLERTKDKRYLLTLDLVPFLSEIKGKNSTGKELQSLAVWGNKLLT